MIDLFLNGLTGFIFGYKLIGLFFSKPPEVNPQDYIFSTAGSVLGGIIGAAILIGIKWYEKDKQKLKAPERRTCLLYTSRCV